MSKLRLHGVAQSNPYARVNGARRFTMITRFDQHCRDVLLSTSLSEFSKHVTAFAQGVGMDIFGSTVITDHSPTLTEFQYITNAVPEYRSDFEDLASAKLDPVSQHCKGSSKPIVWNQTTYLQSDRAALWEHQAPFGYRSGISVAMHLPRGRHFLFGLASDKRTCCAPHEAERISDDVRVFAGHAQAAAADLCLPYRPQATNRWDLTKLELDPMRWAIDGLTNREIGDKLGLSEFDVARRLQNSMRRLDCSTRYEALLRAIKLGLIDC